MGVRDTYSIEREREKEGKERKKEEGRRERKEIHACGIGNDQGRLERINECKVITRRLSAGTHGRHVNSNPTRRPAALSCMGLR